MFSLNKKEIIKIISCFILTLLLFNLITWQFYWLFEMNLDIFIYLKIWKQLFTYKENTMLLSTIQIIVTMGMIFYHYIVFMYFYNVID